MTLPTFSIEQIAHQLTDNYWRWANHHIPPPDRQKGPIAGADDGTVTVNLSGLNAAGKKVARLALASWSDATGLIFLESSRASSDIVFDDENKNKAFNETRGWVSKFEFINVGKYWLRDAGTTLDSYGYQTYLHEIGHALGLGHAGNYNLTATYSQNRSGDNHYLNDSWKHTVMSYFSQRENTHIKSKNKFIIYCR